MGWPTQPRRRRVSLYGALAEVGGAQHQLAFDRPIDAIKGLCILKGDEFTNTLANGSWRVVVGPDHDTGRDLDENTVLFTMGRNDCLHIVPAAEGAKKGGLGKILLGVALVGLAVATGGGLAALGSSMFAPAGAVAAGTVAAPLAWSGGIMGATVMGVTVGKAVMMLGVTMLLGGVAQAIAPKPELAGGAEVDAKPSYLFNNAVNTTEEGGPVPLAFGLVHTGSQVISATLDVFASGTNNTSVTTPSANTHFPRPIGLMQTLLYPILSKKYENGEVIVKDSFVKVVGVKVPVQTVEVVQKKPTWYGKAILP